MINVIRFIVYAIKPGSHTFWPRNVMFSPLQEGPVLQGQSPAQGIHSLF